MKKNRKHDTEEQILDEIRERVIEESENLKAEKEKLTNEKVNLEALQEMTDLPMSRIREISDKVKAGHNSKKDKAKERLGKIIGVIILIAAIAGFSSPFVLGFMEMISNNQKKAADQAQRKSDTAYFKLLKTIETGNLEMVKYHVLEEKIPVEIDGFESESALMTAVRKGNTGIAGFLLENGADVLKKNKSGQSVMDIADESANITVKRTISTALVNTSPEDSPIRELSRAGHYYSEKVFLALLDKKNVEMIKLFLRADTGAYSHAYDEKGILVSAEKGYLDILTLLFSEGKGIPEKTKNLALIEASLGGHVKIIDFLIEIGADVNFIHDVSTYSFEQNFTPLLCAIQEQNAALEHLLKKGADPDLIGTSYDMLPVMVPMYYVNNTIQAKERLAQIKLLIKYGADINKTDKKGQTSIEFAMTLRPDERRLIMAGLIEAGAKIPETEEFFRELIFINDVTHVKKFLDSGTDPDTQGFEYYDKETTALIASVIHKYYKMSEMLIEYGADINYETPKYHKTPLLMAVINEDLAHVTLLLGKGAKVTQAVIERIRNYYEYAYTDSKVTIKKLINARS